MSYWRRWGWVTALLMAAVATGLHLHEIRLGRPPSHSDLLPPWVGARAVLAGHDPYSEKTTAQIQQLYFGHVLAPNEEGDRQAFAYPIYTTLLIAPMATLPLDVARVIYVVSGVLGIGWSVLLWLRMADVVLSMQKKWLLVSFALASWPVVVALHEQQLAVLDYLLITAGFYLLWSGFEAGAGIVFALATMKPQMVLLSLAWVVLWGVAQRRWRFVGAMVATGAGLLAVSEWMVRGWLVEWLGEVKRYSQYTHSRPYLEYFFGRLGGGLLIVVIVVVGCVALWKLRQCEPRDAGLVAAASISLAAMSTASPTSIYWVYGQISLIPGCMLLLHATPAGSWADGLRRVALACLAWGFVATVIAVVGEYMGHPAKVWEYLPYFNPLLPPLVMLAIAVQVIGQKADDMTSPILD